MRSLSAAGLDHFRRGDLNTSIGSARNQEEFAPTFW